MVIVQVFEATISWVKYDVENRSKLFPKLFLSIRLSLIQVKDLITIVEDEKLVSSNSICKYFCLYTVQWIAYYNIILRVLNNVMLQYKLLKDCEKLKL